MSGHRFEAMGCEVTASGGTGRERRAVEELFHERDRTFSRFRQDSELNRVNSAAGRPVPVTPLFARTLGVALLAAEQTGGWVDPTLGASLAAAGYTRDFALLGDDPAPAAAPTRGRWRSVILLGGRVRVPEDVELDLNGVVKALAVDDALRLLSGGGFVSAGGDIAVRGDIDVALPDGDAVQLRRGALATSGTARRHWVRGGQVQHHLIDPRSGLPSDSPWQQVTVCGGTCLAADVAAKAGFLIGEGGPAWLDRRGLPGRFLTADGEVTANRAWRDSVGKLACT